MLGLRGRRKLRKIVLGLLLVLVLAIPSLAADRDEFRRSQFEDGADNEVLIQRGNTGTGHMAEYFDGTVSGGTLIYRLLQSGTIAQIEAIHAIYLNYTTDSGVGSGIAIFGLTEIPGDPPVPPANMGKFYVKDVGGLERIFWIDSSNNVFDVLLGGSGGTGAPAGATYIVQTAHASLSAEQALDELSNGLLLNTGGVLSQATAGTDYLTELSQDLTPQFGGPVDELIIAHTSPATASSEFAAVEIQLDVDDLDPTSEVHGINIAASGSTSGKIVGLGTHSGVDPIHMHVGAFQTPDQSTPDAEAGEIPSGGSWSDGLDGKTIFEADDDEIYIGAAAVFGEVDIMLSTVASQDEIIIVEFENTDPAWVAFTPLDGTNGFTNDGIIEWNSSNLTNWKNNSDPGGADTAAGYWIRIRRTRNTVVTDPIVTTIKTLDPTEYGIDEDGDLSFRDITAVGAVDFGSATSTKITASTDPDVTVAGQISYDTDNNSIRGFDGSNQPVIGSKERTLSFTISSPLFLLDAATFPLWRNNTGFTFNITAIYSSATADDYGFTLKEVTDPTDFTALTTIEAITIATDGTGVFYNNLTSGIDHTAIEDTHFIIYDAGVEIADPDWVHILIVGWLDADVAP